MLPQVHRKQEIQSHLAQGSRVQIYHQALKFSKSKLGNRYQSKYYTFIAIICTLSQAQIRESICSLPGDEKDPKSHEQNDDHPVDTQPLCPATQEARRHDESENGSAEHDGGGVAQWDQPYCHKHAGQEPSPQQPLGHGATPDAPGSQQHVGPFPPDLAIVGREVEMEEVSCAAASAHDGGLNDGPVSQQLPESHVPNRELLHDVARCEAEPGAHDEDHSHRPVQGAPGVRLIFRTLNERFL